LVATSAFFGRPGIRQLGALRVAVEPTTAHDSHAPNVRPHVVTDRRDL